MNFVLFAFIVVGFITAISLVITYSAYKKHLLLRSSAGANRMFLIKGVNTISVGIALLIGLYSLGEGPWLLGGWIPIFAGNMHMIFYLLGKEGI